ncbi:MAG: GGDEF domain-containing protein [Bacillota bacterium]
MRVLVPSTPRELLLSERAVGTFRKWAILILGLVLVTWLNKEVITQSFLYETFIFSIMNILYTFCLWVITRNKLPRLIWYIGLTIDMAFVSFLINQSGGFVSQLFLLYVCIMILLALQRPGFLDTIFACAAGHITFALGLLTYYGNTVFYSTMDFWAQGLLSGLVFLVVVAVIRSLDDKNIKLEKAKDELERTANQLAASNQILSSLAVIETDTGLCTADYFKRRLEQEVSRAQRYGNLPAIMVAEIIASSKGLNDTTLSREKSVKVADALRKNSRFSDICARLGPTRFAIILVEMQPEATEIVATKVSHAIIEAIADRGNNQGEEYLVNVAMALFPSSGNTAEELLAAAEKSLVKKSGSIAGENNIDK